MLLEINNKIHAKYDKMKDPWRMLSFLVPAAVGITFAGPEHNFLGLAWLFAMIISRMVYMVSK